MRICSIQGRSVNLRFYPIQTESDPGSGEEICRMVHGVKLGSANTGTDSRKEARGQCGTKILPSRGHRLAPRGENPGVWRGAGGGSMGTHSACA